MWIAIRSGEQTGRVVAIETDRFVIGREDDCDLLLPDEKISRHHAAIIRREGSIFLEDLGSTNGTFLDGVQIRDPVPLQGNEQIRVGDTLLVPLTEAPTGRPTTIGVIPTGTLPPTPPRPSSGYTAERQILRRSVKRATIIGIGAGVLALAAVGVIAFLVLTGDEDPAVVQNENPNAADIVEDVRPATVSVDALVNDGVVSGGTGWVLDAEEGHIVTNAHVVNGGETFTVALEGEDPRPATVVGAAPCEDLAVLDVEDTTGLEEIRLGSQADLRQGETVVALGFPASASESNNLSATVGAVSVVSETFDLRSLDVPNYPNVIRTDTAINPGNSGGPLVDLDETLVGVNSAGITLLGGRTIQGESFAIGVDRVKEIVPTLRSGESIGWTGIGLEFPTNAGRLRSLGLPAQPGLIAANVVEGTTAQEAGFGDAASLIVAINGSPLENNLPSYCDVAGQIASGDSATLTVFEPGAATPTDVEVTFE